MVLHRPRLPTGAANRRAVAEHWTHLPRLGEHVNTEKQRQISYLVCQLPML